MLKSLRQWTPDDEQRLLTMIAEGKRIKEVAAELKRSVGAIYARAHQLHIPLKRVRVKQRSCKPWPPSHSGRSCVGSAENCASATLPRVSAGADYARRSVQAIAHSACASPNTILRRRPPSPHSRAK